MDLSRRQLVGAYPKPRNVSACSFAFDYTFSCCSECLYRVLSCSITYLLVAFLLTVLFGLLFRSYVIFMLREICFLFKPTKTLLVQIQNLIELARMICN